MVGPNPNVSGWDGVPRDHRLIDPSQLSSRKLQIRNLWSLEKTSWFCWTGRKHLIRSIPIFRRCCNLAMVQSLQPRWEFSLAHPSSHPSSHFQALSPPFQFRNPVPPHQKHATQSRQNGCVAVAFAHIVKSLAIKVTLNWLVPGILNLGSDTEAQNTYVSLIEPTFKNLDLCLKIV